MLMRCKNRSNTCHHAQNLLPEGKNLSVKLHNLTAKVIQLKSGATVIVKIKVASF